MNTELGKMQKMIFKKNKLPFKKRWLKKMNLIIALHVLFAKKEKNVPCQHFEIQLKA